MWRTVEDVNGTRLLPVAVPGLLTGAYGRPVLLIEDNDGEVFSYPPEEAQAGGFGAVLVVAEPTAEQAQLLARAAGTGYPVEPRVAGEAFLPVEEL